MSKILVSACLPGYRVRYDAQCKLYDPGFNALMDAGLLLPVCPEVDGGLLVPRLPAEIVHGDGEDVVRHKAAVIRSDGLDVSEAFLKGASHALALAQEHDIRVAILKSKSPSCSNEYIYDGTFSGSLKKGVGVTTALLREHGVLVFDENHLREALEAYVAMGFALPDNVTF